MTQEDKELLLKDLSARLPYDVMVEYEGNNYILEAVNRYDEVQLIECNFTVPFYECKPYLRPMSSMTEEEEIEYDATFATIKLADGHYDSTMTYKSFDFLNARHFDYRGLIEKGLAIEAQEGMYLY